MRRLVGRPITTFHTLAALLVACLLLGACASGGSGTASESAKSGTEQAAPPKGVAAPAGHPLANVEMSMRPDEVRKLMGEPDSEKRYPGAIWKNFIPFYFGADSGNRVEYGYAGKGRVVFSVNRWSSQQNVVRVDYDPNEDGE